MTTAADVRAARDAADLITDHLRVTITAAYADGVPVTVIAAAAGLTRQRVYQILGPQPKPSHP
jgi:hypothetical protein